MNKFQAFGKVITELGENLANGFSKVTSNRFFNRFTLPRRYPRVPVTPNLRSPARRVPLEGTLGSGNPLTSARSFTHPVYRNTVGITSPYPSLPAIRNPLKGSQSLTESLPNYLSLSGKGGRASLNLPEELGYINKHGLENFISRQRLLSGAKIEATSGVPLSPSWWLGGEYAPLRSGGKPWNPFFTSSLETNVGFEPTLHARITGMEKTIYQKPIQSAGMSLDPIKQEINKINQAIQEKGWQSILDMPRQTLLPERMNPVFSKIQKAEEILTASPIDSGVTAGAKEGTVARFRRKR